MSKMLLTEYTTNLHMLINKFEEEWEELHRHDPANFPITLDEGEWDEQLLTTINLRKP